MITDQEQKAPQESNPEDKLHDWKCVRREITADHVCVLKFEREDGGVSLFDEVTFQELDAHLEWIEKEGKTLKGVVFFSPHSSVFLAGADLKNLQRVVQSGDAEELRRIIRVGQKCFQRISHLPIATVAAVHGACVGGGCELILACDYRIASKEKVTKIGLPETMLGILPGWGGCTRLPHLIGLPKALNIILGGRVLSASQAKRYGLVDTLVHRESLLTSGIDQCLHHKKYRETSKHAFTNLPWVASVIAYFAGIKADQKTGGHYPAIPEALRVVRKGAYLNEEASLANELDAIVRLAFSAESRQLVRLFFLKESAKKKQVKPSSGNSTLERGSQFQRIQNAMVIGAGVMGSGIAQWLSSKRLNVILKDIHEEAVANGIRNIAKLYTAGVKHRKFNKLEAKNGMNRISPVVKNHIPLASCEVVIEAAVEKMDLKKKIFSDLGGRVPPETILATNTSALSITELSEAVPSPERVVGIHFFNPVHRMELVEVVRGEKTSTEVINRTLRFVQQIGKSPVLVNDSPGFLVNRILVPYLLIAGHLYSEGASVKNIDDAMLGFGMPMGPLRLIDEVGTDVSLHVAETLVEAFPEWMSIPPVLPHLVENGALGRKSGRGFYCYEKGKVSGINEELAYVCKDTSAVSLPLRELEGRMVLVMINESARCLEEGVVACAGDIDFGMVMGSGFAPFLGGPCRYADSVGIRKIVKTLEALEKSDGSAYACCDFLKQLSKEKRGFYEPDM